MKKNRFESEQLDLAMYVKHVQLWQEELHQMLLQVSAQALPIQGVLFKHDEAIQLCKEYFPKKPYCLVQDWALLELTLQAEGQRFLFADKVIVHETGRFRVGSWIRTGLVRSISNGCLLETNNTVYALVGNGRCQKSTPDKPAQLI